MIYVRQSKIKIYVFLVVIVTFLFAGACVKRPKVILEDQLVAAAKYTANTTTYLADKIHRKSIGLDGKKKGYRYCFLTKRWRYPMFLWNDKTSKVKVKFFDENKKSHKYFQGNTDYFYSRAKYRNLEASFKRMKFAYTGVHKDFDQYTVNGKGRLKIQYKKNKKKTSIRLRLNDLLIKKLSDFPEGERIPESGTLLITVSKIPIEVTYDGTKTVKVKYTFQGETKEFDLPLDVIYK